MPRCWRSSNRDSLNSTPRSACGSRNPEAPAAGPSSRGRGPARRHQPFRRGRHDVLGAGALRRRRRAARWRRVSAGGVSAACGERTMPGPSRVCRTRRRRVRATNRVRRRRLPDAASPSHHETAAIRPSDIRRRGSRDDQDDAVRAPVSRARLRERPPRGQHGHGQCGRQRDDGRIRRSGRVRESRRRRRTGPRAAAGHRRGDWSDRLGTGSPAARVARAQDARHLRARRGDGGASFWRQPGCRATDDKDRSALSPYKTERSHRADAPASVTTSPLVTASTIARVTSSAVASAGSAGSPIHTSVTSVPLSQIGPTIRRSSAPAVAASLHPEFGPSSSACCWRPTVHAFRPEKPGSDQRDGRDDEPGQTRRHVVHDVVQPRPAPAEAKVCSVL